MGKSNKYYREMSKRSRLLNLIDKPMEIIRVTGKDHKVDILSSICIDYCIEYCAEKILKYFVFLNSPKNVDYLS